MARPRLIRSLKRLWLTRNKRSVAGFTLIELLVSIIIGAIITIGLLTLVVELTDANQKDAARSETQRDMQAALDYITQDLREAVFVYDGVCLQTGRGSVSTPTQFGSSCPRLLAHLPPSLTADGTTPVLAFWRADALPNGLLQACQTNATSLSLPLASQPVAIQGVPCVSGRTYSLVVYAVKPREPAERLWRGRARLIRYQLSKYPSGATSGATVNPGYVDPLPNPNSRFQQWPYQVGGNAVYNVQTQGNPGVTPQISAAGVPDNTSANFPVLVDFVDDSRGLAVTDPQRNPACPANSDLTPPTATIRSFYACVRGNILGGPTNEQVINQEVTMVLSGNVAGRSGFPLATQDNQARLFPLQTRVLIRGILNKNPE